LMFCLIIDIQCIPHTLRVVCKSANKVQAVQ
jgi:hypothetical protein